MKFKKQLLTAVIAVIIIAGMIVPTYATYVGTGADTGTYSGGTWQTHRVGYRFSIISPAQTTVACADVLWSGDFNAGTVFLSTNKIHKMTIPHSSLR